MKVSTVSTDNDTQAKQIKLSLFRHNKKKTIPIRVNYRYQSLHMIFCLVTNIR